MINAIVDGISVKLNETFGDKYTIYSEEIKQGFQEPCFFIVLLNPSKKQLVGQRYEREHYFDIHFFPSDKFNMNQQINAVADELLDAMEYITVNDNLVRGTNMKFETVDNVLHFFVSFNFIIRKVPTDELHMMETLHIQENTKG